MSFVGARFDREAVRQILPPEIKPASGNTGTICVYSAGQGWGIAPYSACFAAIEVEGFDSPDGSACHYMAAGYFSGRAGLVMRRDYNENVLDGAARHFQDGDIAVGAGGPRDVDALTIRTRPSEARPLLTSGVHHYLGRRRDDGVNLYAVAFTGEIRDGTPVSIEITESASRNLLMLKPVEMLWAFECHRMTLTFGAPRPVGEGATGIALETNRAVLLSVFTRIAQAAVMIDDSGRIIVMNSGAEELIGDGIRVSKGRLRASTAKGQSVLDGAIQAALQRQPSQFEMRPIAIDRASGAPIVAKAMPVDSAVVGRPAVIVLMSDPARESRVDLAPALELFGLTPAEARLAVLVGSGRSPREAAAQLNVTEHTARTYLKTVYGKLEIGKQTELARIVTRLESMES